MEMLERMLRKMLNPTFLLLLMLILNLIEGDRRSADSSSATHFFLPNFRTIQTAKKDVARYEERVLQSLVGVFNKLQREKQGDTISNYSASTWLKRERPKYSHKLDYCDYCVIIATQPQ